MIKILSFVLEGNPLLANPAPTFDYALDGDEELDAAEISIAGPFLEQPSSTIERAYRGRISYGGSPLRAREEYEATLRVKGKGGSLAQASVRFLVAPNASDFKGGYIGCALLSDGPLSIRKRLPSHEGDECIRAVAYIAAVGYHEIYLSGRKVSSSILTPSQSNYAKRVYFEAYDLLPYMNGKDDVFGIVLANGWFGSKVANMFIELRYASGKKEEIYSTCNGDWWFATSPMIVGVVVIWFGSMATNSRTRLSAPMEKAYSVSESEPSIMTGFSPSVISQTIVEEVASAMTKRETCSRAAKLRKNVASPYCLSSRVACRRI